MDWRIQVAVEAMERELERPLALADLAARVHLSRSRFAHLFREQVGCSPTRYLRALRLDRARLLLETTAMPVRAVMAAVGFRDPSHFARDFRHRHGASPRRIRPRARSPGPASLADEHELTGVRGMAD